MPTIRIDNQELYYTLHKSSGGDNQRPPLLLVHGAGGHHLHWPPQLRRLPATAVYALDLPGHGQSAGPGRTTIAGYAQVIGAFADALALPSFILAGHSMGGAIALEFALTVGERLTGLVLVGAGARLRVNATILTGIQNNFDATTAQLIDWMYTPAFPPKQREQALAQLRTTDPQTLHDDFAACDAFDVRGAVASLTLPTLIICGTVDLMTPIKLSETLHQAIAGSQLHRIEGAGHMAMIEQPVVVTEVINRWLVSSLVE
ncbi:MAG: alpha/beta hydrolase [Caldilinea sp. CFX5]|nr:alpha/beta hydrolase [Caldilinea sp. CFX5]